MRVDLLLVLAVGLGAASTLGAASPEAVKIYKKSCASCHGLAGDGKGKSGKKFKTPSTDFTDPVVMGTRTDDELFEVTKLGPKAGCCRISKDMPAYAAKYSDEQIREQVALIREFVKPAAKEAEKPKK